MNRTSKNRRFGVSLFVTLMGAILLFLPLLVYASPRQQRLPIPSSQRQELRVAVKAMEVGRAFLHYAEAHHGKFPYANNWEDAIRPYLSASCRSMELPIVRGQRVRRLAMNRRLSGQNLHKMINPGETVLLFEIFAKGPNASGVPEEMILRNENGGAMPTVCYADGRVNG